MSSRLPLKKLLGRGESSAPTIPPNLNITIRRQHRRSLMMRPVPGGFEVYIPRWMRPDNPKVTEFIHSGLQKLGTEPPPILPKKPAVTRLFKWLIYGQNEWVCSRSGLLSVI